jgi:hypothetical protein
MLPLRRLPPDERGSGSSAFDLEGVGGMSSREITKERAREKQRKAAERAQPTELLDRHREFLHDRAIGDEVIEERGYVSVWNDDLWLKEQGFNTTQVRECQPALVIPMHSVYGELAQYQLRPDAPREVRGKVAKYEPPPGTANMVDVHPRARPYLDDPSRALIITEGIPKADAAVSAGLCCIAITGAFNWRGTTGNGGTVALPDWELIATRGLDFDDEGRKVARMIYLVPDSDYATNATVRSGFDRLARLLESRGAKVQIVVVPAEGDEKVGLDDWLASGRTWDDLMAAQKQEEQEEAEVEREQPVEPMPLADAITVFQKWLYLPDPAIVEVTLAAVVANYLAGEAFWLLIVCSPGRSKTETLNSVTSDPDVYEVATLTEAALLSGSSKKDWAQGATGGALPEMGRFGILCAKDFGSVLSMHRDARAAVLAALREVYDGSWTRLIGEGGGRKLSWKGKVGFIGGCTPKIDSHHAVMQSMGERFMLFRAWTEDQDEEIERQNERKLSLRALEGSGTETQMREELARAAGGVLETARGAEPYWLTDQEMNYLVELASLVARCRSAVERDSYSREIETVYPPEAPTRLSKQLDLLLSGLVALGLDPIDALYRVVTKVALDNIEPKRLRALEVLLQASWVEGSAQVSPQRLTTKQVAEAMKLPTNTAKRALEDLTAHGVVERKGYGQGKPDKWRLAPWALDFLSSVALLTGLMGGSPEKSSVAHKTHEVCESDEESATELAPSSRENKSPCAPPDFSGEVDSPFLRRKGSRL